MKIINWLKKVLGKKQTVKTPQSTNRSASTPFRGYAKDTQNTIIEDTCTVTPFSANPIINALWTETSGVQESPKVRLYASPESTWDSGLNNSEPTTDNTWPTSSDSTDFSSSDSSSNDW